MLSLLIFLGWYSLHEAPTSSPLPLSKVAPAQSHVRHAPPVFAPGDDFQSEEPSIESNAPTTTNAAALYRQAFALLDALSQEEKTLVSDWRTNVDAAVEAELCEKIHPICELMHQAMAMTNCDWNIEPLTFDTKLPHLNRARTIARTAIWSAAHCRSNDATGATDDVLSALHLGQDISHAALIACLVDMALQDLALSWVAMNLELFRGADGHRLATAFDAPAYEESPARAMEQEADIVERFAAKLAALPATEADKEMTHLADMMGGAVPEVTQAAAITWLKQIADADRKLAAALASSSADDYEACLQSSTELQQSNPLAKMLLGAFDAFVDKVQCAAIKRDMIRAGLAVARAGPDALQSHPDPATGQPFVYTKPELCSRQKATG